MKFRHSIAEGRKTANAKKNFALSSVKSKFFIVHPRVEIAEINSAIWSLKFSFSSFYSFFFFLVFLLQISSHLSSTSAAVRRSRMCSSSLKIGKHERAQTNDENEPFHIWHNFILRFIAVLCLFHSQQIWSELIRNIFNLNRIFISKIIDAQNL